MNSAKRIVAFLLVLFLLLSFLPGIVSAAETGETYYTNPAEVAVLMREAMVNREETITVHCKTNDLFGVYTQAMEAYWLTLEHTGVPGEGDNLKFQFNEKACDFDYETSNQGLTYYAKVTLSMSYFTDAAQEAKVDEAVDALLEELALEDLSDAGKVRAIYDWICANVAYDTEGMADDTDVLKYTTYGALVEKSCVSEGYANLFYRLALECGIDCRIISGTVGEEDRVWNIVALDGVYYNLDASLDAGQSTYSYFLKSHDNFSGHERDYDYDNDNFYAEYPKAEADWSCEHDYASVVTAPTCTEGGYTTYTCSVCNDTYVGDEVAATGHNYSSVVTAPTCTEDGYTTYTCSVCADTYVGDKTNAAGHALGEWYQSKAPNATENGENRRDCTACDYFETEVVSNNPFTDIAQGKYYYNPVLWAYYNNITKGLNATTFGVNSTCTREQVVTFLWCAAGRPEPQTTENPFTDVVAGKYYYKAVLWAVENGITKGSTATTFGVGQGCTRAQVVTFIWSYFGRPEPSTTENSFSDVEARYYYKAVLWAVENGVTSGYKDGTFKPDTTCTREQIVTFLYRALVK